MPITHHASDLVVRARKLILFCAFRMRYAFTTKTLKDMVMTNVIDMEDGFTEWKMQGVPVEYLN